MLCVRSSSSVLKCFTCSISTSVGDREGAMCSRFFGPPGAEWRITSPASHGSWEIRLDIPL